ncbi:MAG: hypothetical protein WD077_04205 [Bacteroidia bacterium]
MRIQLLSAILSGNENTRIGWHIAEILLQWSRNSGGSRNDQEWRMDVVVRARHSTRNFSKIMLLSARVTLSINAANEG